MSRRRVSILPVLVTLLVLYAPSVALAGGGTLYVDGKTGDDANEGSHEQPLKTIAKAAAKVPAGSGAAGWTIVVQGYDDYVYRERPIPPGWDRRGASGAPVRFVAAGYDAGSASAYTKPIVSGADRAPASGERWTETGTAGVWSTPWSAKPFGFGTFSGSLRTALFQDTTVWLWEQSSLSALGSRAAKGLGGYWYDAKGRRLYASARGSTLADRDPAAHEIDVVMRNTFLFVGTNGASRVEVRGFEVRHSANGIAFVKGVDYSVAADNVVTGNLMMGIQTSGGQTSSGANAAVGNTIARNRGTANTIQAIKIDEGSVSTTVCDNEAWGNGLQGIKIQGPPGGTGYTGTTHDVTICRNRLHDQTYNPTGSAYNNASGLTIANGAYDLAIDRNEMWRNDVGIHLTQEASGRRTLNDIVLSRNSIHDNRRFGIYFFDGSQGTSSGAGTVKSKFDLIWGNGIGVMVGRGSSHKLLYHATVFRNLHEGIKVGESGKASAGLTVKQSLVTSNRGYGLWLVTGNRGVIAYTGFRGNALGNIKGSPSKTAVNTKSPGYLSTTVGDPRYLRISASSYQYTAGPSKTPIGARY